MSVLAPNVRNLIACEKIESDVANPSRTTLINLIGNLFSMDEPSFPASFEEMAIYVQLTECRGSGKVGVDIIHDETGEVIYNKKMWDVQFANQPLRVLGLIFRLHSIRFPAKGFYWIRFWFNDQAIDERLITLRGRHE